MRLPPLAVLLSWPTPNYDDPVTHGQALFIVNLIFIILVAVAVTGRLYSRIVVKRWYGWDDSMIVLAFVRQHTPPRTDSADSAQLLTIGMTVVVILANDEYGWNRHEWDLSPNMIVGANKIAFAAKLMFSLAATFTRISLICFYYRLVKDAGLKWFNWVLHASLAWTVAVCICFMCETIFLCSPIKAYWVFPPMPTAHCLNEGSMMLIGGIMNCFSDLLTTVLPIPIVAKLQMPLKERIGVCVLLCLGVVVTIAGAFRTFFIWKSLIESYDETWFAYPLWIAAAVEIHLAVICACAPAWKSLLRQPIAKWSSALSSKISSLRSPHRSPDNSNEAPESSSNRNGPIFYPLRSLPWFQVTRLDFEKHRSASDLEEGVQDSPKMPVEDHQIEMQADIELRDFRHSDSDPQDDDLSIRRTETPSLLIMKRSSLQQESAHIDQVNPRRPIGVSRPGQWLGEKASKKLFSNRQYARRK